MPGGVLSYQQDYIDENLKNHLSSSDYLIGTLEVPIGTGLAYDEEKMQGRCNIVYAQENDFRRVRELGFKAVSLANNHVMDLGPEGLANTIKLLKESGIQYFGAGMNAEEASQQDNGHLWILHVWCTISWACALGRREYSWCESIDYRKGIERY